MAGVYLGEMNVRQYTDFLAQSVSSSEEYDKTKVEFLKFSSVVREPIVSGRRVGIFKFDQPLQYRGYQIAAIELIEPKKGEGSKSGFEHAEFIINFPFEELM